MKTILMSIPAYIGLTMIMAYSWNVIVFRDLYLFMVGNGLREHPIIPLGFASMLIESIILSVLFYKFFRGDSPFIEGLGLGLIAGAFSICYAAFVVPSKFNIQPVGLYMIMEIIFGTVHFGLSGIIMGFIFKYGGRE